MKKIIIDEGRVLTHEECVEIAKKRGTETVLMVQHRENLYDLQEIDTEYEVVGW